MIDASYFAHKDVRVSNIDDMFKFFIRDKRDECLRLVLGAALFKEYEAETETNGKLKDTASAKWKNLVNGEVYNDKVWQGFSNTTMKRSFISYYVFVQYSHENESHTYGTGQHTSKVENSLTVTDEKKRINAHNKFVKWVCGLFENDMVSLYEYINDKKEDFPNWKPSTFEYVNVWNA